MRDADNKRARGEKLPDPPQPSIGGRGRRYDASGANVSRPLAAAPGAMELAPEPTQAKTEVGGQQSRPQGYPSYGVPIAQAPQQAPAPEGQMPLPIQAGQHPPQPVSQSMSPAAPPLRAPMQSFGFPEREREQAQQGHRVPLPQKAAASQADVPRHLSGQPLHPSHTETSLERQKMEILQQQQQRREGERDREREHERVERERELARQAERQSMRARPESELNPQRHYEPLGHRQPGYAPRGDPSRSDPLSLTRHPQEPPRHGPPQPYPPHTSSQPLRGLLGDPHPPSAASPPPLAPPTSRPMSAVPQSRSSGPPSDIYGSSTPQPSTPAPAAAAPRPPEPRKSNIMSLLNDDPPPPPKRVNDVPANPAGPSPTPPPQGTGRPPPVQQPPSQFRRESEPYPPYGRPPSTTASAMPSLKPTYIASPGPGSRSSLGMAVDSPSSDRDYYRQHSYQAGHQNSRTNSPQTAHRYPAQPGQAQYQPQAGYPTPYGSVSQPPPSSSPPPQFSLHGSASRPRESSHGSRDSWPPAGHHQPPSSLQQPGSWGSQPPKTSQPPPPTQSWAGQHSAGTPKAGTPTGAWPAAPPPQQPHPSLRDERGPPMYGSQQQPHQMQGRYPPPVSRGPEPVPPPAQAYPRYVSTPGPGPGHPPPRDPRDMPPRSYTPAGYDQRGPPPPPGSGYPGADPRDVQLRDSRDPRDPRDMVSGGLRPPHQYDRHPDPYGR